jgi:predicted dehydrogenase
MVGLSEGNGHPYSFSAIVNGFDEEGMKAAGWPTIHAYLRERDSADFGFGDVRVTHVWTQDAAESRKIARASCVPTVVDRLEDLRSSVDAVILARDDCENHVEMARPFLEQGLPVFIDKPLALTVEDLDFFRPYVEKGRLLSVSGVRYAGELDGLKARLDGLGKLRLARGAVVRSWEKYAIHVLEGIFSVIPLRVTSVSACPAGHASMTLTQEDGSVVQIDALGQVPPTFAMDFWGENSRYHAEVRDFFTAFRRTLGAFIRLVQTGHPPFPPADTIRLMEILMAGQRSRAEKRPVSLDEFEGGPK